MLKYALSLLSFLMATALSAQKDSVKKEFEKRISEEDFPAAALQAAQPFLENAQRVRYFKEFSNKGISYEMEVKNSGRKFSIEFFENGDLMDVEELVRLADLPENARNKICGHFCGNYRRHRIFRVQRQFSGRDSEAVLRVALSGNLAQATIKYELEADVNGGEQNERLGPYQFLFDKNGNLLEIKRIELRDTDNIVF